MTILVLLIAVLVVAWLTAAAMAIRSVSWIWLRRWAEQRLGGPSAAEPLLARPHRLLGAASAGVAATVVLAGAWLGARHALRGWELVLELVLLFVFFFLAGQLVPRGVARRWAGALMPVLVPPLRLFAAVAGPALAAGERLGAALAPPRADLTERDGIEDLLREGELEGIGDRNEIAIITGIVEFGEKVLADVMTSRTEVFALDEGMDPDEFALELARSGYSRVPVYRRSLDEIVGMVHAFDVLKVRGEQLPPLRPVVHAPATKRCSELLSEMMRSQRHLTVVIDEFGGTAGIVTLEDLIEELVGEIEDEHDEPSSAEASAVSGAAIVDADMEVAEVERRFGVELPAHLHDRAQSVGGVLVKSLGRIPSVGERVRIGEIEVTVLESEPSRIVRLLVQPAGSVGTIDLEGRA
jgi:putative hemolysin